MLHWSLGCIYVFELQFYLPWWLIRIESSYQCRRGMFDPWIKKMPWRRKWQPTPVFLPGKSHGQKSLVRYSPWGLKVIHDLATKQQTVPRNGIAITLFLEDVVHKHTHTHTKILLKHKKEWNDAFCPVTWTDLEIIIVSEVNWTKKFTHCTAHLKLVLRFCLLPWVGSNSCGGSWAKESLDQIFKKFCWSIVDLQCCV